MLLCRVVALAETFIVHGLDATALPTDGNFGCDAEFWQNHVKHLDSFHLDTSTELGYARLLGSWISELIHRNQLDLAAHQCPLGVATLTLKALPALDYDSGPDRARDIFDVVKSSLVNVTATRDTANEDCSHEQCDDANMTQGWNTRMILRELEIVERHYYPQGRYDCNGVKFDRYVYETPLTRTPQNHVAHKEYWIGLNYSPLNCRFGMYGTEVIFHEFVNGCRTKDPNEADFFFVPSYFKCLSALNYVDRYDGDDLERPSGVLFNQTLAHVESLPYFARNDGVDHIWLFSWGRYPCILPYRNRLRHARFLQVEDRCEDVNKDEDPLPTFSRWKDIIIPGNTDQWRTELLQSTNRPLAKRNVFGCFHGRHGRYEATYANISVRNDIIDSFENVEGFFVGHFHPEFHDILSRSIFCFAPRGITPWTGHLYQALIAGCIPIILSDHFEVPYPWLDWGTFSIRWPEHSVELLYDYLVNFPHWQRKAMKRRVDEVSCWFDYSNARGPCSPFQGVLRQLQHALARPKIPKWSLPGMPVVFQAVVDGLTMVESLEEAASQVIHSRVILVRPEKRRVLEMYLEERGLSTEGLRTF